MATVAVLQVRVVAYAPGTFESIRAWPDFERKRKPCCRIQCGLSLFSGSHPERVNSYVCLESYEH